MELTNEFSVPVPVEQAWAVLTDLERIAPCMPGTTLEEVDGDGSVVKVVTDLTITGKVAQFGRGVLADVSARLMKEFADRLAQDLSEVSVAAVDAPEKPKAQPAPVDLVATAGVPLAKRAAPLVAAVFVLYWLTRRRRRRKNPA